MQVQAQAQVSARHLVVDRAGSSPVEVSDPTVFATVAADTKTVNTSAVESSRASHTRSKGFAAYSRRNLILKAVVMSMRGARRVLMDGGRSAVASVTVLERPTLSSTKVQGMGT